MSTVISKNPEHNATAGPDSRPSGLAWFLLWAPVGYLWFQLIDTVRLEWSSNPQYSYGWVVPLLCAGLLLRRWQSIEADVKPEPRPGALFVAGAAALAFLYLPTRLIQAATPEWRPIQWLLGIEAIGLTLSGIYFARGRAWARQLAFPICFFLVAIPWPTIIEIPVIQNLTRLSAALAVEAVGWLGIPAVQHGNLIEIATGTVFVEEACSGIRSFQTSLMISLFFGEFYRMSFWRRVGLVPAGFVLAMGFNVCRVSILTALAAKKGLGAIAQYHDPAGLAITVICTAGLWGMAMLVRNRERGKLQDPKSKIQESSERNCHSNCEREADGQERDTSAAGFSGKTLIRLGAALALWLIAVEAGVEIWYRAAESRLKPSPAWTLNFPTENPTLRNLPIDAATEDLLRFDDGKQAVWTEADGTQWQGFYCNWNPGRIAGYLAKRHTPEICLPAAGEKLVSGPELTLLHIHNITLPVRSYVFETPNGVIHVFHCRWESGASEESYVAHESARFNLIRSIWSGRGKQGEKVVELIASGYATAQQAEAELTRLLDSGIKVQTSQFSAK